MKQQKPKTNLDEPSKGNQPDSALERKQSFQNLEKKFNKNNMIVAVRSRPLSQRELEFSNFDVVKMHKREIVSVINPLEYHFSSESNKYINNEKQMEITKSREHQFAFDFAFDEKATQEEVYKNSTEYLLKNVMDGFNATVFAYGATGSGKTYTMVGNGENPGLMVRSISDLFELIKKEKEKAYSINISYIEVYNETLRDLLTEGQNDKDIDIRNDPKKGVSLVGITSVCVTNPNDAFKLLIKGNKRRTESPTVNNENSSRSHAVLEIHLEIKEQVSGIENSVSFGKFILVDLAGSEKITNSSKSNNESGSINKSLLALANCINLLVSQNKSFIPWRDSKLTRILQNSLGGNSRIVMLANISPSIICIEETLYTLQYANRAKNLKINLIKNVCDGNFQISKYEEVVNNLKNQIEDVKREIIEKERTQNLPIQFPVEEQVQDSHNEMIQNKIIEHFQEEIRVKKGIIEKERQIENIKNEISENEYNLPKSSKEDKKNITNIIQAKTKEVETIKAEIGNDYINQSNLIKKRKEIQKLISKAHKERLSVPNLASAQNMNNPSIEAVNLMNVYKYYVAFIENISSEHRKFVASSELNRKDKQILQLTEQLDYRDQFIDTANKELQRNNVKFPVKNNKFQSAEEINLNPYCLPLIKPQFEPPVENNKMIGANIPEVEKDRRNKSGSFLANEITKNRQYNHELLPLVNKSYKSIFLEKFDKITDKAGVKLNNNIPKSNQGIRQKKSRASLSKQSKFSNYTNKMSNSPAVRQYGYSPSNLTRRITTSPIKNANDKILDRSFETHTSNLETEMNNKVKTILTRDIIGRYKRSPYIRSDINADRFTAYSSS